MLEIKGRRPEKYRDRPSHAIGVPDDGPVTFEVIIPGLPGWEPVNQRVGKSKKARKTIGA